MFFGVAQEHKRNASTETVLEPMTPSPDSPTGGMISQLKRSKEPFLKTSSFLFFLFFFAGSIAARALQYSSTLTISTELENLECTHGSAEIEAKQTENKAEGDVNQREEREERREATREDSLRLTSWVEVETKWAGGKGSAEAEQTEGEGEPEGRGRGEGETAERERSNSVEEELALMEEKWKEQCAINETLKQRLANEEERFRVSCLLYFYPLVPHSNEILPARLPTATATLNVLEQMPAIVNQSGAFCSLAALIRELLYLIDVW